MKTLIGTMLCVAILLASEVSRANPATVPNGCASSALAQRSYLSGYQQGVALTDRAWLMVNDCGNLNHFSQIIHDDITALVLKRT